MNWKQIGDQVAHVVVFGAFAAAHPAAGLGALVVYELTSVRWNVGPVTIGQWPPGNPWRIYGDAPNEHLPPPSVVVTAMDRVEDLRLDLCFSFLGIALGSVVQDLWMGGLL